MGAKVKTRDFSDVAIIIPAYNEGPAVRQTIDSIPKAFPNIICVDDGSRDDTATQVRQTRAALVRHAINLGQGAAIQTGLEFALENPHYNYFVTFDADGQHQISDVEHMITIMKRENLDIVLGSRFLGHTVNMSRLKKLTLKLAIIFSNLRTGIKLTDAHNGLRALNRKAASVMDLQMPDFSHATEIIERIAEAKLTYKEVPVTIVYTAYSQAKGQSIVNSINIAFDLFINRLVKR